MDDVKTEKIGATQADGGFFSERPQEDNYTELDRANVKMALEDDGKIGFMDDDTELQPKNTLDFSDDQQQEVLLTWEQLKRKGINSFAKQVIWNFLTLNPEALSLYSFRDVENLYQSPEMKKHQVKLVTGLDNAISLLGEPEN